MRAVQLKEVHKALFTQGVYAGIVGGDMSATDPEDKTLAEKVGFMNLWEVGGGGNDRSGGPSRYARNERCLDRVMGCDSIAFVFISQGRTLWIMSLPKYTSR